MLLLYNKIQFYKNIKAMREESTLAAFSSEMPGPGLQARRYNSQEKFPLELQAEKTGSNNRTVSLDGDFHR